jgi:hypothetical protein
VFPRSFDLRAWPGAVALAVTALAVAPLARADSPSTEFLNALVAEQLRYELRAASRTLPPAASTRHPEPAAAGPKSWNPAERSPWANAYGTPAPLAPVSPRIALLGVWRPVRLCSCYLPADARSWDGGPLTEADVARMCRAQCN